MVEESRNAKEMMGWLEGKIKECKVTFDYQFELTNQMYVYLYDKESANGYD